jgi:hypothetical protein
MLGAFAWEEQMKLKRDRKVAEAGQFRSENIFCKLYIVVIFWKGASQQQIGTERTNCC